MNSKNKNVNIKTMFFDIQMRIEDGSDFVEIGNKIAEDLIFCEESPLFKKYSIKYDHNYKLKKELEEDRIYAEINNDDDSAPDLKKLAKQINELTNQIIESESPFSIIREYLQIRIQEIVRNFLDRNSLSPNEFTVQLKQIEFKKGSLLVTFNLVASTIANVITIYNFISDCINDLVDDVLLKRQRSISITAIPNIKNKNYHDKHYGKKDLKRSLYAIMISILAVFISIICGFINSYFCNERIQSIRQETKEIIQKDVPEKINEALYRQKVDFLFNREVIGRSQLTSQIDLDSSKVEKNN